MGPFTLYVCVFLCGFYPFVCERDNTKDAGWNIFTDGGAVFHTQGFLGRGEAIKNKSKSSLPWPYLSLPMSQDSIVPLVNKELMMPSRVTGHESMPENLRRVLLPGAQHNITRTNGRKDVAVKCTFSKMRVRVRREPLGSRALSSQLSLGTCSVSNKTENFFFFCYNVSQCGSKTSMINNQLVYSNTLYYNPEAPNGPIALPISCHYNRFYYSYKIGYVPVIRTHQLFKNIKQSGDFSLTPCNAEWERLPEAQGYIIGSAMYFEARSPPLSGHQRLFINFCYATPFRNVSHPLRFMLIENYGCMVDSMFQGSQSRFVRHRRDVVRFEVEAFLFKGVVDERLYMHCEMFVGDHVPTEIGKSCTYNSTADGWEELYGDPKVCSCCNITCDVSTAEVPATKKIMTSTSWMLEPDSGTVVGEATVEWDEISPTETETVTQPMVTMETEKSSGFPDSGAFCSVDFEPIKL
ncbi:hypothetical protein SKAU_G00429550 [Synaphobranchus kaupii]|uniref:Zona pellucida sperm-binding protein 3 n=1 Tax=Synaphobranchus kaupii TaxID=118154 RepID=A0A9Q1IA38_SYNKA|nr:hypothetical protein SKAU_G00429550 [Synaphobranchus kaupii]